jgi:hypothetical protein
MLRDQINLLWSLHAFYDLLRGPRAILVNTNHRQMGADTVEHRHAGGKRALLEKLLDNLFRINNDVLETCLERKHTVLPNQSEARSTISPSRKSAATCSISSSGIVFESILLRSSRNFEASQRLLCGRSDTRGMVV